MVGSSASRAAAVCPHAFHCAGQWWRCTKRWRRTDARSSALRSGSVCLVELCGDHRGDDRCPRRGGGAWRRVPADVRRPGLDRSRALRCQRRERRTELRGVESSRRLGKRRAHRVTQQRRRPQYRLRGVEPTPRVSRQLRQDGNALHLGARHRHHRVRRFLPRGSRRSRARKLRSHHRLRHRLDVVARHHGRSRGHGERRHDRRSRRQRLDA